jgi:ABC-type bacteriocin/lantibiotic exporter with double-glycine peptidase domain
MLTNINLFFKIISNKEKFFFFIIIFLYLFLTFLETVGISLVVPAIYLLSDYDQTNFFYKYLSDIKNYFNFSSILNIFFVIFFFFFLFKFFVSFFINLLTYNFVYSIHLKFSNILFRKNLELPLIKFSKLNHAKVNKSLINDIQTFTGGFLLPFLLLSSELIIIIGLVIFLLIYSIKLTFIVSFFIFFVFILFFYFTKKTTKYYRNLQLESGEKKIQIIQNSLKSFIEIKVLKIENYFLSKFSKENLSESKSTKISMLLLDTTRFYIEFVGISIFILIFFVMSKKTSQEFAIATIAVYAAVSFRAMPSFNRILNFLQRLRFSSLQTKIILEEIKNYRPINNILHKHKIKLEKFKIIIKNVNFSYDNKKILYNLNLKIGSGDKIFIQGKSGTGKTTFLYLLSGLLKPDKGIVSVYTNGNNFDVNHLNNFIGYVPQTSFLINDTILNNITFGTKINGEIFDRVNKLIKVCELESFIKTKNEGFNSMVGENATRISGGQRQRISIARALLKEPSILILDEATNALDFETEKKLLNNIISFCKQNMIIIMVSHRKNSLIKSFRILNLRNLNLK